MGKRSWLGIACCAWGLALGCSSSPAANDGGGTDGGNPADAGGADGGRGTDAGGAQDSGMRTDAGPGVNVCGATSATVAWTASIPAPSTSLTPIDIVSGLGNDVIVGDVSDGATFDQYRWTSSGTLLHHHQDARGAYAGTLFPSSLFIDMGDDLFYGFLLSGGANTTDELDFTRLSRTGTVVFANPQTASKPAGSATSVEVFQVGGDNGGGLHGTLQMGTPQFFAPAVYCWGSDGTNVGPSAGTVVGTLAAGDFLWPSQDASLYLFQHLTATTNLGCGALTVPAGGAYVLGKFGGGGNCLWTKLLSFPTAAVMQSNFRLAADASLVLAVVFNGTLDFGGGPVTSSGTNSLGLARYDSTGTFLWEKTFGGAGSSFQLGSVGANDAGTTLVTAGYAGAVDLGGGALPGSADTFVAVFDAAGTLRWAKTVSVGNAGELKASIGPCGVGVATNSTSVDLGTGPLATQTPPAPASIGVAALGL